jgi:gliding motility-associated-like protein
MEQYPINELRVFDRWGVEVLYVENYKNDWEGTWSGGDLPDGVYFYLFTFGNSEKMSGYVYLRR